MNETELLESYRPWLRATAGAMLSRDEQRHVEDLAQEAWVALWRELRASGRRDPAWLKTVARNRMRNVIRDSHAARRDERRTAYVADVAAVWEGVVAVQGLELAYHHGQIGAALDVLTTQQREYVVARFWGGLTHTELTELFGYQPQSIWTRARPKLAVALAHLEDVAG